MVPAPGIFASAAFIAASMWMFSRLGLEK